MRLRSSLNAWDWSVPECSADAFKEPGPYAPGLTGWDWSVSDAAACSAPRAEAAPADGVPYHDQADRADLQPGLPLLLLSGKRGDVPAGGAQRAALLAD